MARATVVTRGGASVTIEGTQEEVAQLVERLDSSAHAGAPRVLSSAARTTPMSVLTELIERGYFSAPKELGTIRSAMAAEGHFYPSTTLSPLMLRLVRRKDLRRIKDKGRWAYVR